MYAFRITAIMLNRGVEATKFDVKDKSCIYYLILLFDNHEAL